MATFLLESNNKTGFTGGFPDPKAPKAWKTLNSLVIENWPNREGRFSVAYMYVCIIPVIIIYMCKLSYIFPTYILYIYKYTTMHIYIQANKWIYIPVALLPDFFLVSTRNLRSPKKNWVPGLGEL